MTANRANMTTTTSRMTPGRAALVLAPTGRQEIARGVNPWCPIGPRGSRPWLFPAAPLGLRQAARRAAIRSYGWTMAHLSPEALAAPAAPITVGRRGWDHRS